MQEKDSEKHLEPSLDASTASGSNRDLPSNILSFSSGLSSVAAEELLWKRLAILRDAEKSLETMEERKEIYTRLAVHYQRNGGTETAIRHLKNALEQRDDPKLRRQLARLQGFDQGFDFITTFDELLKSGSYDLKTTLEFCSFLELRGFHEAALNVLESELKKRLRSSAPVDSSEATIISGFLALVQARIGIENQAYIYDYLQLIATGFPKEIYDRVVVVKTPPKEVLVGESIEEYESDYGLYDEIKHISRLFWFFGTHYTVPVSIIISAVTLIFFAIYRVPFETIRTVSALLETLLIFFLGFEIVRSIGLQGGLRLRVHTRVANDAALASLCIIGLNFIGGRVVGVENPFFSMGSVRLMSFVLVISTLWRTYLAMSTIRRIMKGVHSNLLQILTRRALRRRLADVVNATSRLSLMLQWGVFLQFMVNAPVKYATYSAIQAFYFCLCWRWAYLELHSEKQKLRDALAFLIAIAFCALAIIKYYCDENIFEIVVSLSFDGAILLAIIMAFVLQLTDIGGVKLTCFSIVFMFLNFSPVFKELFKSYEFGGILENYTPALSFFAYFIQPILLVVIVRKMRRVPGQQVIHKETYMDAKYKIMGGQQGAVGDEASAQHFTQLWQASASGIELSKLAAELANLREKLAGCAQEPSHFQDLGHVATAEEAAKQGNGATALEELKKVTTWLWDRAAEIGTEVATAAAKKAIGL